jgi:hypothetical protein
MMIEIYILLSIYLCFFFKGWRLKVGEDEIEDRSNTSRIHVDYAQARDDQYEWECHQRQLAREHRHRQRMEEERLRPPSPPPIIHFSEHEAAMLVEHLKGEIITTTVIEHVHSSGFKTNHFWPLVYCRPILVGIVMLQCIKITMITYLKRSLKLDLVS